MPTTKAEAKKKATKVKKDARGLTSGRLLTLYNQAVANGTSHQAFVSNLVQVGGYKNKTAAAARLGRLRRELSGRGLSLVPLAGARLGRSNEALRTTYSSCLIG